MTFPIGCSVSFCLKTLPLNTPLFEETVFEKSQVFNLSRFKIGNCVWWCFVRVRTFEITEWVFCSVLLESTVIKFWLVNKEIKSFPRKSKIEGEEFLLLQDEHIIVLCFYFSCWLWNVFFVDMEIFLMESTFILNEPQLFILQDKHYELSVAFEM